jgi:RimJ/RimL family protein N-acetyltransferase
MAEIRILRSGDEAVLERFLLPRIASSMFLIGNQRAAGLEDNGQPYQGTYAAAFEGGGVAGVVAHYWNGNLILQAPAHLDALWRAAAEASGRRVRGMLGPAGQVAEAMGGLGVAEDTIQLDETENLYSLDLAELMVPEGLRSGRLRGRRIEAGDVDLVTAWRVAFSIEALGEEESPKLWAGCRSSIERSRAQGWTWLLEDGGQPVACSSFNTAIQEAVQIGGVWTPPELRRQGYGRAVVAASLLDARAEGATTSILFTGVRNVAAQKAYTGLGYRHIGDYRLVLLRRGLEV